MDIYPSYLKISKKDLEGRIEKLFRILENCEICPRCCHVNRTKNERGICKLGILPMVSSYSPHFGEERPLVGTHGSGTIFFTSCNLSCVYCQNYEISQLRRGAEISFERLAEMMIDLQNMGCHNINLVTPSPQVAQIVKALPIAIDMGLKIPLVYNTSSYDSVETLKLLDGIVDIYLPDAKYSDNDVALKYSHCSHYFETMKAVIKEMYRQVGNLKVADSEMKVPGVPKGVAIHGVMVRHLVFPNDLAGSEKVFEFMAREISKDIFINIMDQYSPCYRAFEYPHLSRQITDEEYKKAVKLAKKAGLKLKNGQETEKKRLFRGA